MSGASNSDPGAAAAVSLLFARGSRPSAHAVRSLAEQSGEFSVSLDPAKGAEPSGEERQWLELLASGLTFDLAGLAPGPAAEDPPRGRSLAVAEGEIGDVEAVTLRPGPHLAAGAGMVPLVRMLAALAASLCGLDGTRAVAWHPARCWSAADLFREGVLRWVEGGVFPGLTLATLSQSADGGMQSEGLALFTGQELRLEPSANGRFVRVWRS